ncbi:unnamed protein product [Rotaria magnacalcarata]|uniref:Uncharacterized protein n=3 Tax=Rotaria magnacalcarata TaxID=392030 RepID=A0A816QH17_9BILA|nr:unnamed protein product [Rotaria magnacalcarata]CAF4323075.1 unnamed protein product [Rotaria magnacalcarata]
MTTKNTNSYNREEEQQDETLENFDKMSNDLSWNMREKSKTKKKFDAMEEQNLSEKMRHLSTTTTHEKHPIKILKEIRDQLEIIPNYLTKQNISFKKSMHQVLSSMITAAATAENSNKNVNNINELRKIAILLYKIMVIQTYQYLWEIYFKSGTGQLMIPSEAKQKLSYSTTLSIWPKEIKTIALSNKKDKTNENEICLKFTNGHLYALKNQLKEYQQELNIKANNYPGYTLSIQEIIKTYIEENLNASLYKKIQHQVALIHYDYHIRALKLEYLRHKPNEYQKQLMIQICQSKYEQETSEHEYEFLKQQIAYYNLPRQSFECSTISHHPSIDSIQNVTVREALMKQFKEVAIQSRNKLFNLYLESAEDQREEYKKKHQANVMKMDASPDTLNNNEKLSSTFVQLINERCNKISERIKCTYKFKSESIPSKS